MASAINGRPGIRDALSVVTASIRLFAGLLAYSFSRRTPAFAYQSLIRLFTLTSGRSNDALARAIGWARGRYPVEGFDGVLGFRNRAELEDVVLGIRERGYHVFDRQLPADLCEQLYQFALTQPCRPRATDSQPVAEGIAPSPFPRSDPQAIIYDFSPHDLINNQHVQALMGDRSINALAEAYLDSKPVLDTVNMWWTTAYSSRPDAAAAQLYHFDMDHVRWLKFFIYLTDMTPESGPHCFVAGTHRSGRIPRKFLSQGYARLSDSDIAASFPAGDVMEFMGLRGTIIAEDTRGLHKGKPVLRDDRLMFELEFSNSLFGAVLPARGELITLHSPEFKNFVRRYRRIFSRWMGARTPV
jgi:hypothetical protein